MRLLVDMNLSPEWLETLSREGWQSVHWSDVGSATAEDIEVLSWAQSQSYVIMTQDLDFGQLLFNTRSGGPSTILLRIRNEFDLAQQARICAILRLAQDALERGALLVIDEQRARLRRLPIEPGGPDE
jgi:predicted nuclease of predicted toxin-antitoxin system